MVARVGRLAPDFRAEGYHQGRFGSFQLSEFRGHWVLLCFYPGDFTFVCPTELAAVAARYSEMRRLDVQPLAVSTDSKFVHKVWHEEELSKMVPGGLPFPMLCDLHGQIGESYGVYAEEAGVELRGRFLIDPEGIIQATEVILPAVGQNIEEIIRQVLAFQHQRTTGESIPTGWEPGMAGLRPGPELVGKVWKQWSPAAYR